MKPHMMPDAGSIRDCECAACPRRDDRPLHDVGIQFYVLKLF